MNTPVISADKISKHYGELTALHELSFNAKAGTCLGLLGPNGAGKSTLMKIIYGKGKRSGGELSVFGHDPGKDALAVKALTGVVPQEDSLDPELDVRANMRLYARFYGITRQQADRRIDELLSFMELGDKVGSRIRELSGGMKRRLVIARALLGEPRLLILDEPTTGLDPQVRHLIWDRLHKLRRAGTTILLTTHYMDEAYQLCDNLIIMDHGKALLEGNPRQLVEEGIETYVLQIFNPKAAKTLHERARKLAVRFEEAGGIVYAYAAKLADLEKLTTLLTSREYNLRQTNLEDLFLRATGKGLNNVQ